MSRKRLKLKIGPVEIEFEGDQIPPKDELHEIVSLAADVYKEKQLSRYDWEGSAGTESGKLRIHGSTASIAGRLNCVSGPELIIAAAARLTFVDGEEWFESDKLLREMKNASAHFEASYGPALLKDIEGLVKSGKLVEVAPNLYALSATTRRDLQRALAE